MTTHSASYSQFVHLVNIWWTNLEHMISAIHARGNKPVLIALSRKMPRFMDWFREKFCKETGIDLDLSILDKVELTTELAIPFIWANDETDNLEFIILDDIIIHGTSLRYVAGDLHFLTNRKSHVSCIMRRMNAEGGNFIIFNEYEEIPVLTDSEAQSMIDIIADIVEESELPIDMEFPVFSIDCKNSDFTKNVFMTMKTNLVENKVSVYDIGSDGSRFSSNIPYARIPGRNNDFAKLRFFRKHDKVVFETICPMLFSQSELVSVESDIFNNNMYADIWNLSTAFIRNFLRDFHPEKNYLGWEKLKVSFHRSLCVWASYLFSLSAYAKNAETFLPTFCTTDDIRLSIEDLSLILGTSLSLALESKLSWIVESLIHDVSLKDLPVTLPDDFCPSVFESTLIMKRVSGSLFAESVESVCIDLFLFQHYLNPLFANKYITSDRLFFGETYNSLKDACRCKSGCPSFESDLHKWIDQKIDAGYVVPKYECVEDKNGSQFWRRFFHAGIRRLEDPLTV